MKPGRVVSVRVSPQDCMGCVDVVEAVGLNVPGMSFSQVVSMALKCLVQSARNAGAIPSRSGFEYSQLMQAFEEKSYKDRGRKLAITETLNPPTGEVVYPTLRPEPLPRPNTPQRTRLEARASELRFQRSQDPENFSPEQQAELEAIADQLAGL